MKKSESSTIAVLGHCGQLNLGDEAILSATIEGIRRVRAGHRLICISLNPGDSEARHGVDSFPLRPGTFVTPLVPGEVVAEADNQTQPLGAIERLRGQVRHVRWLRTIYRALVRCKSAAATIMAELMFLRRQWSTLDSVEVLVVAGSNQLSDNFGGAWGFPYTVFKWGMIARLRGARFVLLSVGAGPIKGWLSRQFVLSALRCSDFLSVRDTGSGELLRKIGWRQPVAVKPDLAFGLQPGVAGRKQTDASATSGDRRGSLKIGVNLMPVHDARYWPDAQEDIQRHYLAAMCGFVETLAASGHEVLLYGTQPADEWIASDLLSQLGACGEANQRIQMIQLRSLDALSDFYCSCDAIVATRFHGILLALRFGIPVLGIAYHRKSRDLMESFGLAQYVLDLEKVSAAALDGAFKALTSDLAGVRESVNKTVRMRQSTLAEQYEAALTSRDRLTAAKQEA